MRTEKEIEKETRQHIIQYRRRFRNIKIVSNIAFLIAGILNLLIGYLSKSQISYYIGTIFLSWLIINFFHYNSIKTHYRLQDMWMNAYYELANKYTMFAKMAWRTKWDGKHKKKTSKKVKKK